jgi:hypothetical protein
MTALSVPKESAVNSRGTVSRKNGDCPFWVFSFSNLEHVTLSKKNILIIR